MVPEMPQLTVVEQQSRANVGERPVLCAVKGSDIENDRDRETDGKGGRNKSRGRYTDDRKRQSMHTRKKT